MYYVYILKSQSSGEYYIGQTQNLEKRIIRHNSGQSRYTKGRGPWQIVYKVEFISRSEAISLEKKLKSQKSRTFLEKLIMAEGIPITIGT